MCNNKSIVLFKTEFETLNLFSNELKKGFEKIGYEIFEFDVTNTVNSLGNLYEYIKNHNVIAMVGFNNKTMIARTPSGINLWEQLGILCINILVDHPYWYDDILTKMPSYSAVLCIDRNHMKYVSRFYPHILMTGFLPHGGTINIESNKVDYDNKTINAIYVGSLYEEHGEKIKPNYSRYNFPAEKIVNETIEFLLENPSETVEDRLEQMLIDNNIKLSDEELKTFIHENVYIERKVSSFYREKLIETIAKSGVDLTIYGNGWKNKEYVKLPNVHYEGFISPKEIITKIANSKIVINSMPWFKDGSHERIFNGIVNNAVVVTERNPYVNEILSENMYIPYDLNIESISSACESIKKVIDSKELFASMTEMSYNAIKDGHTWIDRAREIHEGILMEIN